MLGSDSQNKALARLLASTSGRTASNVTCAFFLLECEVYEVHHLHDRCPLLTKSRSCHRHTPPCLLVNGVRDVPYVTWPYLAYSFGNQRSPLRSTSKLEQMGRGADAEERSGACGPFQPVTYSK